MVFITYFCSIQHCITQNLTTNNVHNKTMAMVQYLLPRDPHYYLLK
jgi:hypothetical protein